MGKTRKGVKCSVIACEGVAVRSLSLGQVESSGLQVEGKKKAYLCKTHYKDYKKKSKDTRQVERWRWRA